MSDDSFDYIIVGAGSAGCVLAEQLSLDPSLRILVIEAGEKDSNLLFRLPVGWAEVAYRPKYNWGYRTIPEASIADREMIWPRAKVLGGCSSTNGLVVVRGQSQDYDHWASLGNNGWSWQDVLPYFKRIENYHHTAHETRGTKGLMHVQKARQSKLSEAFLNACDQTGTPRVDDFNTGDQWGASYADVNIFNGRRQSASHCFLTPALNRPNVTLMVGVEVKQLLFHGDTATGVETTKKSRTQIFHARREVLVCAGAINSPLLLEASGIGQRDRLSTLNIECRHELPGVGENLQDHLGAIMAYQVSLPETVNDQFTFAGILKHLWLYWRHKEGLLNYPSTDVIAFLKSDDGLARPDLQIHFTPASGIRDNQGKSIMDKVSGITALIYPTRPTSRGSVHLTPDGSCITPNYLSTEYDCDTTLKGIEKLRQIFNAAPLAPFVKDEIRPGKGCKSREDILRYVAETSTTSYHPVGTCKMGHDPLAVVDDQLRVHGLKGLRVIDASIMPTLCSGNTNAATMMIAMKASEMIRAGC